MARWIHPSNIALIIWHCSATKPSQNVTARDIQRWHKGKGWSDIGYHYVIERDGHIAMGREIGLRGVTQGAHCRGQNHKSIGVCVVGGLYEDGRSWRDGGWITSDQRASMSIMYNMLLAAYPRARHAPHNAFAPKDCPCFKTSELY